MILGQYEICAEKIFARRILVIYNFHQISFPPPFGTDICRNLQKYKYKIKNTIKIIKKNTNTKYI